jgi:selenocysteine lyase/cysteine desulfurase
MRDYRQDFADFSPLVYLDCAYQGPVPRVAVERFHQAVEQKFHPIRITAADHLALPDRVRTRIAGLTGADAQEIAVTNSATQGIGIAAAGLPLGVGDEVVVASVNFPSNLFTWLHLRRKGVKVIVIHPEDGVVSPDQVAAALTPRTRILALDWVNYSTGYRIDLATFGSMIHDRGGIFVVDGSQGVGANELNLHALPVDILACAGYKWLLGAYGTGFAYVARDLLEKLDMNVINWFAVEGAEDFDSLPKDDFRLIHNARMFDSSETGSFINLNGFEASLEFIAGVTTRNVNEHCRRLLDRLGDGLLSRGYKLSAASLPGHESSILCFRAATQDATLQLRQRLTENHFAVSLRQGMIRVSPYLYNTEAEIDRMLELIPPI